LSLLVRDHINNKYSNPDQIPIHEKYGSIIKDDDSKEFMRNNVGLISVETVNRLKLLAIDEDTDAVMIVHFIFKHNSKNIYLELCYRRQYNSSYNYHRINS
jgi:hypothetical protein